MSDRLRKRMEAGAAPRFVGSPGTDGQEHAHPTGGAIDCIACGPGHLDLARQPDEHVEVRDLVDAAAVMALDNLDLLTIER